VVSSVYDNYKNQLINLNQSLCGEFLREDAVGLTVYAINGNVGYKFLYYAPADNRFDRYLDGFKNMIKTPALISYFPHIEL
jgi:hypothetical protein